MEEATALLEFGATSTALFELAITLGLGLLVGMERERAGKEVGLRTFSFTALLGYLAWKLGAPYALLGMGLIAVLVVVINASALRNGSGVEATTSVSLFLIYVVGILVSAGQLLVPVAVVIMMLALLSWKEEMVTFSNRLQRNEIHAAITLGILSFVVLPVLPEGPIDPWGLFEPRKIWIMVVLISSIGFGNYILLKLYGARGITFTGFFGGLVNSTAAAMELAQKAREDPGMADYAFRGIMWAKVAAFLRNALILAIFAPGALPGGILPIGTMLAVALAFAWRGRPKGDVKPPELLLQSPFSLKSALNFGLVFAVITVIGSVAQSLLGAFGFYAVSFAGGMVSSSSTAASAANLASLGQISAVDAGAAVVLSSIASALVILPLVWKGSGSASLAQRVSKAVVAMMIAMAASLALNPLFVRQYAAVAAWLAD